MKKFLSIFTIAAFALSLNAFPVGISHDGIGLKAAYAKSDKEKKPKKEKKEKKAKKEKDCSRDQNCNDNNENKGKKEKKEKKK